MAVLGVAVAGAAIGAGVSTAAGGAIAMTTAISAGWAVGSLVGQYYFGAGASQPGQDTYTEGARMSSLVVRGGSYGTDIPEIWGVFRVGGLIIWKQPIREEKITTTTSTGGGGGGKGGKGGGGGSSHTEVSYEYYGTWACLLCEGLASIRKIWMNSKLVYDVSESAAGEGFLAPYITIYNGDGEQLPDPTMEAVEGVGNVPAHRGVCYLVLDGVPLADTGNSLPNLEAEVYRIDSDRCLATGLTLENDAPYLGQTWYTKSNYASYGSALIAVAKVRTEPFSGSQRHTYISKHVTDLDGVDVSIGGEIYLGIQNNIAADLRLLEGGRWVIGGFSGNLQQFPIVGDEVSKNTYLQISGEIDGDIPIDSITGDVIYRIPDGSEKWWFVEKGDSSPEWQVRVFTLRQVADPYAIWIETFSVFPIEFPVGWEPPHTEWLSGFRVLNGDMFLQTGWQGAPAVGAYDLILYEVHFGGGVLAVSRFWALHGFRDLNGIYGAYSGGCYFGYGEDINEALYLFRLNDDPGDGSTVMDGEDMSVSVSHDRATPHIFNIGLTHILLTTVPTAATQPFSTLAVDGVSNARDAKLSEIIGDTCLRCGLEPFEFDASGVAGQVTGFARTGQMTGRSCISSVADICSVNAVESGGAIRWQTVCDAGPDSGVTIQAGDLSAHIYGDEAGSELDLNRVAELEVPREVEVTYADPQQDYDTGTQRAFNPLTSAKGIMALTIPAAMLGDSAKSIAERYLDVSESERISAQFRVGIKYLQLEPGDVFEIERPGGNMQMRMTGVDISPSGLIDCKALVYDASAFSRSAVADAPDGPAIIPLVVASDALLMDVPVLRADDVEWNGLYAAGYQTNTTWTDPWPGADLYSQAGVGWTLGTYWSAGMVSTFGQVNTPAGGTLHPWNWDDVNEIIVTMTFGTLSSSTDLEVQAGANQLAVGVNGRWEIIGFVNAQDLGGGQYRLTRLLRARRGTEQFVGTGIGGDLLILLDVVGVRRVTLSAAAIGADLNWRVVPANSRIGLANDKPFVMHGIGLIPFSPVHIEGTRVDGDLRIDWTGRSRCAIEQMMGEDYGSCEATEQYHVELRPEGSSTLLRTIVVTEAMSTIYTLETYHADSGQGLAVDIPALDVTIYQISAVVGRGYPGIGESM